MEVETPQPWKWSMLYWSLMINFFCFYLNRMSVICKCHRCGICCNWFLWFCFFCLISSSPSLCYHTVFCKCLASLCCRIIYIQRKCLFIILTAVYNIIMYNVFFFFFSSLHSIMYQSWLLSLNSFIFTMFGQIANK